MIEPDYVAQLNWYETVDLFTVQVLVFPIFEVNTHRCTREKPPNWAVFHGVCFCQIWQLERGVDEDRTEPLKLALERIWKQTDPWSQLIKRKSFTEELP